MIPVGGWVDDVILYRIGTVGQPQEVCSGVRFHRVGEQTFEVHSSPTDRGRSLQTLGLYGDVAVHAGSVRYALLHNARKSENPCARGVWCGTFERIE
jgi:hypothetical protein